MASIGHVAVGMLAGRLYTGRRAWAAMLGFSALSLAPDLDVIGFRLGIPYADPLGHRGASHALFTALLLGLALAGVAAFRGAPFRRLAVFAVAVLASHGLLDAATDGGLGAALLWPFSDARIFWPVTPLPVAPIGRGMLSARGLEVLCIETLWFAPMFYGALRRPRPPSI